MNLPQMVLYFLAPLIAVLVMGRRGGKTHGVAAPWLLRNTLEMPGSAGGIVCATFQQALMRTLPGTLAAMEELGYYRNIHYYVGVKPPESAGFKKPVRDPISYDRCVTWFNGSIWYLISQDVPGSANSLTLQWVFGDEAKFINFEKLKKEVFPANGGFPGPWRDCPWLNSMLFISDMPTSKKGSWFMNYETKATPELNDAILAALGEIYRLSQQEQTPYIKGQITKYRKDVHAMRREAVYYKEYSSIENILVIGEKYIRQQKRDLPPLVFQTSILCVKPGKLRGGFYPGFTDSHVYTSYNNAYLKTIGLTPDEVLSQDCRQDGDLLRGEPIFISFDYNANINWLVAAQICDRRINILKSFYVKYERKIRELVDDFCEYYKFHDRREVIYYYDHTAMAGSYAANNDSFKSIICEQFRANGWRTTEMYIGQAPRHKDKYNIIFEACNGNQDYTPMINEHNNAELVVAIGMAGVKIGTTGFEKDKSGEKLAESEEDLLEYRTDGTDALDTIIYGILKFRYTSSGTYGIAIYN